MLTSAACVGLQFRAWAPSAAELFLEAGAEPDFLRRLSVTYLPKELQQAFQTMVSVRSSSKAPPPQTLSAAMKLKAVGAPPTGAAQQAPTIGSSGERVAGSSTSGRGGGGECTSCSAVWTSP